MRFLLDQDVYAVTARLLQELGHDILTARSIGMSRADDAELLVNPWSVLSGFQERAARRSLSLRVPRP